jgi:SAM-dependent methyltransferase
MTDKVDFDNFAGEYEKQLADDLKFFGEENSYFAEYKIRIVTENINKKPEKIIEYGCGIGRNIPFLKKYFPDADVYGCDISKKSLEIAAESNSDCGFFEINDENLAKHYESADLIFISCVFHHIEPSLRADAMSNVNNLLNKGGNVFFFEHNQYNPVTRRIVNTCVWDTDAILLKPGESKGLFNDSGFRIDKFRYTLFFPSFMGFLRPVEKILWFIPMGGQYYIKAVKE